MKINGHTFAVSSSAARLTLTYTHGGALITTHEYGGALIKRASVQFNPEEVAGLYAWLGENLQRGKT